MPAISAPATVLVTGANGYIGLWAVLALLTRGYSVRGAVRSASKVAALEALVARKQPEAKDRFKGCVVEDITADRAFDEALQGADGVIHTASPISSSSDEPESFIKPAVKGTLSILESALKTPSVKRVVVVSSVKALSSESDVPPRTYTEEDWNENAVRIVEAQGRSAPNGTKYDASKALAQRAAWDFLEQHKSEVAFDLTVVNPAWVFGPVADDTLTSPSSLPGTPLHLYNTLFAPDRPPLKDRTPVCTNFAHIGDITEILVRSLELPEAGGEQFIANACISTWAQWLLANQSLNLVPALERIDPAVAEGPCPPHAYFANDKSKRFFGIEYRGVHETLKDAVEDYRARGWLKHLGLEP
ncbi:NAD-P-binding protein [Trametes coccinea BRFM310]|uniref:NAD-P-binding protein n=1 Tax=Trametes coccinea (strain BRFM310) TaxID=1353009 RepID=A0A1Y2IQH9_TRAC3|nr:NAD-P-binding protein [Trametes coccinea BRFM310]